MLYSTIYSPDNDNMIATHFKVRQPIGVFDSLLATSEGAFLYNTEGTTVWGQPPPIFEPQIYTTHHLMSQGIEWY